MDSFEGEPNLTPHADGIHWTVNVPFIIHDDELSTIIIPAGFITDLGSIPKIFQNIISPAGKPLRAYLGHDHLYSTQMVNRKEADDCLFRMMSALGEFSAAKWAIYLSVRLGGWLAWNQDAKEKNK